ncbi:hypothetical protein [Bacillus massiliglaciei]|uniref:hypothetical protein n=1 Tax=Bacillus massiliglaciei TaxID=1816693 RepID=UPI001F364FB2|nr:hypothetical protein [Bacillus massiliglaciei]
MFQTKIEIKNIQVIDSILQEFVQTSYNEAKEDGTLLCMECGDVDLYIAASHHEELQDAINENFAIDDNGEIIDREQHQTLMDDLYEYFLQLHIESGFFDYFPAGFYEVKGEKRESETDMLAPKGKYFAPFEDALK